MSARPERLRHLVEGSRQRNMVVDEVQRVPDLLTEAQALLLYRGHEELLIDGIRCLPVETFLRSLVPSSG